MKTVWYLFVKAYIKLGLFFYSKKTRVYGSENVPKKGAVLFAVNHPNGLLDPLVVATHSPRISHFLVRAAVFKKPLVKKFLATLNLMPIYRIRDGRNELSKNTAVFNDCFEILKNKQALMIFPEGSHDKRRTIRPISKGFTRIVFGALEKHPTLKIQIIPVGLTYQKAGDYPSKIALHFGKPILANDYFNQKTPLDLKQIDLLKKAVRGQLKKLSVHIPADENYESVLQTAHQHHVDFTQVHELNMCIEKKHFTASKKEKNYTLLLYYLLTANSILPLLLWRMILKKIDEIEFIDTFRFALMMTIFPIFYLLQTSLVWALWSAETAMYYLLTTLVLGLIYTKTAPTPAE